MKNRTLQVEMEPGFTAEQLKEIIAEQLDTAEFAYRINKQSLDARRKNSIRWILQVETAGSADSLEKLSSLEIPRRKRSGKAVVVGSGPAGFFAASVLLKAGFETTVLERGADVDARAEGIAEFEENAVFNSTCNYAFGEGGAGTFSDGKLTSRSKRISLEREFIISEYIRAGAPDEAAYFANPHIGTGNLKKIVKFLREEFIRDGGEIHFEQNVTGLEIKNGKVHEVLTGNDSFPADYVIFAPGLAAYDTYRMLIENGVKFRPKGFAIGHRVEHEQAFINQAQWGAEQISGLKAAEYRLTASDTGGFPVYTFCMCPGGTIVPSTAFENMNIVNGMSEYERDGRFANAGVVAGIHPDDLLGRRSSAIEAIEVLEELEQKFFYATEEYRAPFCGIRDYIKQRMPEEIPESTYSMGLEPYALWNLLPRPVSKSIRKGLQVFGRKIHGFPQGIIMGLESKTSSPVQVVRDRTSMLTEGFDNLFVIGEGSGWAGGIITSGADGIKAAMKLAEQ